VEEEEEEEDRDQGKDDLAPTPRTDPRTHETRDQEGVHAAKRAKIFNFGSPVVGRGGSLVVYPFLNQKKSSRYRGCIEEMILKALTLILKALTF
jgi:hypothetical protein